MILTCPTGKVVVKVNVVPCIQFNFCILVSNDKLSYQRVE